MTVIRVYHASWQTPSMYLISQAFWKISQCGILSPGNKECLALDTFSMPVHTGRQWLLRHFPVSYKSVGREISSGWIQTGVCPAPPAPAFEIFLFCPLESLPREWQNIFGWLWETNAATVQCQILLGSLSVSYGQTWSGAICLQYYTAPPSHLKLLQPTESLPWREIPWWYICLWLPKALLFRWNRSLTRTTSGWESTAADE